MKSKLTLLSALIGGMFSAQASFAADTVCSVAYRISGGTVIATEIDAGNWDDIWEDTLDGKLPAVTIAVASNFYSPAINLITTFMSSTAGTGYAAIGICHNATGHLVQEITGSNPAVITGEWLSDAIGYKYGIFFAADVVTPLGLLENSPTYVLTPVKLYANGIPALLANPNRDPAALPNAAALVTATAGAPTGYLNGNPNNSGQYIMNTGNLSHVAIGSLTDAPYGIAAKAIIQAMNQWSGDYEAKTGNTPTPCTGGSDTPNLCEYDNINITFTEAVSDSSNLDAGWVSWAQILASDLSPLYYVTFPDFAIGQAGVRLTNPNPSGGAGIASDVLWSFMNLGNPSSTSGAFFTATGYTWNQWLATQGYGALDNPNPDIDPPEEN